MGKRSNGDGSVFKRKSGKQAGTWVAVISLPSEGGKPKRKSFSAATRKEATVLLERAKKDRDAALRYGAHQQTVEQFLLSYLDDVAAVRLAPLSLLTYRSLVKNHLIPRLGHHRLYELTPQHIQQALNAETAAGASPRSVRLLREILRGALNQAMTYKLIADNPAAPVEVPKVKDAPPEYLDPDQAKALLRVAESDRQYALYATALMLGLRRGEVLGLRWKDIDFSAGTLQVAQAMQVIDGKVLFPAPKTKHSRRLLPLPGILATILHDHRGRMLAERLAARPRWPHSTSDDLVFVTEEGEPIPIGWVRCRLHQLLDQAGVARVTFHALRHSCATLLISLGVPLPIVRDIMGHSTISMTMHYTHVMDSGKTQAMDAMSGLFKKEAI